jgi:hypothetical protein
MATETGTFLIRNTAWSRALLEQWWSVPSSNDPNLAWGANHEESALAILYGQGWGGLRNHTQVFRPTAFNSVPPFHHAHDPSQPIMHAAGEPRQVRDLVFQHLATTAMSKQSSPMPLSSSGRGDDSVWGIDIASALPLLGGMVERGYEDAHEADPKDAEVASTLASILRGRAAEGRGDESDEERARLLLKDAMSTYTHPPPPTLPPNQYLPPSLPPFPAFFPSHFHLSRLSPPLAIGISRPLDQVPPVNGGWKCTACLTISSL